MSNDDDRNHVPPRPPDPSQPDQDQAPPLSPAFYVPPHKDAQDMLALILYEEPAVFYTNPFPAGLLLAQDRESYIMRVGALLGARRIGYAQAATLVRGMNITILNPEEGADM